MVILTKKGIPSRRKPPATPGSRKGIPNKVTKDLKDMILGALDEAGGVGYLLERANDPKTQTAFLALVGKVLPMTVQGGGPEGEIIFRWANGK